MEINKPTTLFFKCSHEKMQVLEWEIDLDKEDSDATWDLSCEIMIEPTADETNHFVTIDLLLRLFSEDDENPIVRLKTRHRTTLFNISTEHISSELLSNFLSHHVAIARGYVQSAFDEHLFYMPIVNLYSPDELFSTVDLCIFHLSLNEFAYERRKLEEPITLPGRIAATICQARTQYFLPHQPSILDDTDEETYKLKLAITADYETTNFKDWILHLDTKFELIPVGDFLYRKSYSFHAHEKDFLNTAFYKTILKDGWSNIYPTYLEHCKQHQLKNEVVEIPYGDEMIEAKAQGLIEEFNKFTKPNYERNGSFFNDPGFSFTKGGNTVLMIRMTFVILDEILFLNPNFNHEHNQEALAAHNLPFIMYFSVKQHCLNIVEGKIELTWGSSCWFYMCLDLALQLLISDQGDLLRERLLKRNFSELREKEFIQFGTEFIDNINESLKKDGATINLINERVDWMAIIK